MVGYKKLGLIAAGLLAALAVEAKASPFTEPVFVLYHSSADSGQRWRHGANFLMHFVHWRDENPKFSVTNISWVDHWAGDGGTIIKDDGTPLGPDDGYTDDRIPPWRSHAYIPEPSTALLVGAVMSIVALRRKTI